VLKANFSFIRSEPAINLSVDGLLDCTALGAGIARSVWRLGCGLDN
jgi:hypothetical protein